MATILSAQFKMLLDKHLNAVYENVFEDLVKREAMIPTFFNVTKNTSAWWEGQEITDLPDIPRFDGELEYLIQYPGYSTRIEPGEWAAALRFERKFIDTNQWPVLKDRVSGLSQSLFRTRELDGVRWLTESFSTAFAYMTSEENVALCSTAHTSKTGASTTTGFSNAGTSALNELTLETARLTANRFKNDTGQRIFTNFDTLIVPDSLAKTAYEITATQRGLYSAEGTENFQKGKWKVIVYKLLDDSITGPVSTGAMVN